ncbi:MAG: hypothetical protein WBM52_00930 [Thiogranum sp.]
MTSIVSLGCNVAEIHHKYATIHGALFGAASFRLVIIAMAGRTAKTYRKYLQTLEQLQTRLSGLAAEIPIADTVIASHQAGQLRGALSEYVATLDTAIVDLKGICTQMLQDEDAYRDTPVGGQSAFNRDKVHYDRVLLRLEQLGSRLNRLFSRF